MLNLVPVCDGDWVTGRDLAWEGAARYPRRQVSTPATGPAKEGRLERQSDKLPYSVHRPATTSSATSLELKRPGGLRALDWEG